MGGEPYQIMSGNYYTYFTYLTYFTFIVGTSMATPFIAGFASYVGTYLKTTNPDEIKKAIDGHATLNVVTNAKSEHNNLAFDNLAEARKHIAESLKFLTGR